MNIGDLNCTGCLACYNICEFNAIKIIKIDGFLFPSINEDKCLNCSRCIQVCPLNKARKLNKNISSFVGYDKKNENLLKSSSGAVFPRLARFSIKNNGIVFGAGFIGKTLKHIGVVNIDNLNKLYSSKYLQSNIGKSYYLIKKYLESNKLVLFSGTPCQIVGLKTYLKYYGLDIHEKLYTVSIACHGVPSPEIFKSYIEYLELKNNDKIVSFNFRYKKDGWKDYFLKIDFQSKTLIKRAKYDPYMKAFLSNLSIRQSCANCKFKGLIVESDLIIGDAWGITKKHGSRYNKNGVSFLIVNSGKGQYLYNQVYKCFNMFEESYDFLIRKNPCIYKPVEHNPRRNKFLRDFNDNGFEYILKKYLGG